MSAMPFAFSPTIHDRIRCRLAEGIDSYHKYADALRTSGFSAFDPLLNFHSELCPKEYKADHEVYLEESRRESIASISNYERGEMPLPEGRFCYTSAAMNDLRAKRNRLAGKTASEIRAGPYNETWKLPEDPSWREYVRRERFQDEAEKLGVLESRYQARLLARERVIQEAARFSMAPSHVEGFGFTAGRRQCLQEILESGPFSRLGFSYSKQLSKSSLTVSKDLPGRSDLVLCWQVDAVQFMQARDHGIFDPSLHIRHRKNRRVWQSSKELEMIGVNYQVLVFGFAYSYSTFCSPEELKVLAEAHATLYEAVQDKWEPIMCEELGKEFESM
jgi:hypothetical protein